MKNTFKILGCLILAVVIVIAVGTGARDAKLRASQDDGNVTAQEQQEAVKEAKETVEVKIPPKEEAKEEKKDEPEKEKAPVVTEDPGKQPEEEKKEEPAAEEKKTVETVEKETVSSDEIKPEEPVTEQAEAPETEEAETEVPVTEPEETADAETSEPEAETPEEGSDEAEAEEPEGDGEIEITLLNEGELDYGDVIRFRAEVTAEEGTEYHLKWQYNAGSGWTDIPGEDGEEYDFELTEQNAVYEYRAVMVIE